MSVKKNEEISMMDMLKAGVHFGHKKSKRHPKMSEYIYTVRNGINIIDLAQTKQKLDESVEYVKELTAKGGVILFVGTKRQAKKIVKEAAEKCGMPYVNERWLGGTFTNFDKIYPGVERYKDIVKQKQAGELEKKYTKKEIVEINRDIKRMDIKYGGIKDMKKIPEAIFIVDIIEEETAVAEAKARKVPIVAIVDTNTDPTFIAKPIPSNDDAMRSIELVVNAISEAVIEGKAKIKK
ncbi:MAG: 30S ribosomal protein S2 [Candidatus Paceibacterota bacterium]|jgi:small subunit ribosomal protein S2